MRFLRAGAFSGELFRKIARRKNGIYRFCHGTTGVVPAGNAAAWLVIEDQPKRLFSVVGYARGDPWHGVHLRFSRLLLAKQGTG